MATTEVDQAFKNEATFPLEGQYLFPIPEGATLSKFSLMTGGEELEHQTLDRDEARKLFERIVAEQRNSALLEWMGQRTIRARVAAIPPGGEKQVRVAYTQALTADGGIVKYVYPLAIEKLSNQPLRELSVEINLTSARAMRSVYSPTHNVNVQRKDDTSATVTFKDANVRPDRDLVLYFTQSESDVGLDLLTHKRAGEDGSFVLLAAPKAKLDERVLAKDIVFVFDTSGSMAGEKIEQAKKALQFCLNSLDPRDRFEVLRFSTDVQHWKPGLTTASRDSIREAVEFVQSFQARGGTNLHEALRDGLTGLQETSNGRPRMIVFMTDGLPTVGTTNPEQILKDVAPTATARKVRVFNFGVGHDLNAHFLDKLADDTRGASENVLPKEDIELKVSALFEKIASPLLADLKLDFGKAEVYDVYPKTLPDLFRGSQLVVTGRYKLRGNAPLDTSVTLVGHAAGREQKFALATALPAIRFADDFIPRLWATRKIGWLEDQLRLNGSSKEVVEEIVRLAKEFGILTQYTSFLVETERLADGRVRPKILAEGIGGSPPGAAVADYDRRAEVARKAQSGAFGVQQSVNTKEARASGQAALNFYRDAEGKKVVLNQAQNRAGKTFFQAGPQWIDEKFTDKQKLIKVRAYSPAYFQLANSSKAMAEWLSVAEEVTVNLKSEAALQVQAKEGREQVFSASELKDLIGEAPKVVGEKRSERHESSGPQLTWVALPIGVTLLGLYARSRLG